MSLVTWLRSTTLLWITRLTDMATDMAWFIQCERIRGKGGRGGTRPALTASEYHEGGVSEDGVS